MDQMLLNSVVALDCNFICLDDRRCSVLSRGRSFFLEPDVDVEDSKCCDPVYTPVIINRLYD